jgi:hypothetical protein
LVPEETPTVLTPLTTSIYEGTADLDEGPDGPSAGQLLEGFELIFGESMDDRACCPGFKRSQDDDEATIATSLNHRLYILAELAQDKVF